MKNLSIILKKGKETIFRNRHPWIFSGAIASYPAHFEDGKIYPIHSYDHKLLGHGYFRQANSLAGRVISFGDKDPWQTICENINQAIDLRHMLIDQHSTNAYRLINGEGDQIPGLIVDQYSDYLVLQSSTLGIDLIKDKIVEYLVSKKRWKGIFEKSSSQSRDQEKLSSITQVLWGEDQEEIQILENNLKFIVNWKKGQKTGFFLDQREMRDLVKQFSHNKKVLNCFSYTGGFSVYALKGGAKQVDSLDSSASALVLAQQHVELNQFSKDQHRCIEKDAFQFLREDTLDYDLIILDPPAFIKKKQDVSQGVRGYREINAQVMTKAPKNSFLLTCSCSYYMEDALFKTVLFQAAAQSNRNVQIIKESFHSLDHPLNLFHPEGRYLKSILLFLS